MDEFRIYYADGSTHDDALEGIEPFGVLAILRRRSNDNRWQIIQGAPYYAHDGNEWMVMQLNDVVDFLTHGIPINSFLVGRMVNKKVWHETYKKAQADRDLAQGRDDG